LVSEGEPRLAFIGSDQIEATELCDIAPSAGHLAVGDTITTIRDRLNELGNSTAIKYSMPEIAKHYSIDRGVAYRMRQLLQDMVGDRTVIQSIELQKAIAARDDCILVHSRSGRIDDRTTLNASLFKVF
jgi:hypothetical protein